MLWSSAVRRSICSVLFRDSPRIATFWEIPEEIAKASKTFALEVRANGGDLGDEWLNNGPASLQTQLPLGWENRLQIAFSGRAIHLRTLAREDLLCAKLFAPATVALTSWTVSRLRPIKRNWTRSFHGWSNRTPILSGRRMFV
jgi:hypothetical protein